MSTHSGQSHIALLRLFLASFVLVAPGFVSSRPNLNATKPSHQAPSAIPAYGRSAWECPRGFEERGRLALPSKYLQTLI